MSDSGMNRTLSYSMALCYELYKSAFGTGGRRVILCDTGLHL